MKTIQSTFQDAKQVPPELGGGLPFIGHTADFVQDTIGLLRLAKQECGAVAKFHVLGRDMVLLTGPEAHEAFFRAPNEQLSPSEAYKMMVPVFGKGVAYDNDPRKMFEQLHMLVPALQDRRMRTYSEIITSEVEQSISEWGDEGVIDFYTYVRSLTLFTSSHCLLGREFRMELTQKFAEVYHALERSIVPLAYINPYLPIPVFRKRDRARAHLGEMVTGIVERRRASGHKGEDFLQTLMEAHYSDGTSLTNHEITGMLIAAMFSGHHTSSVTTAWTLLELLQHPDVMREVQAEMEQLFGHDQTITYSALHNANETEWTIQEALRLHPPLFMLLRAALQDVDIAGYHIPAGAWCIVSPLIAHSEEVYFKDATRFDPQRFAPGREEDKKPYAYIPFGGGRHVCLGNSFAMLQIKTILAVLLRGYDFELFGDPIESDFQGLVIGPKIPCRVRYQRRGGV